MQENARKYTISETQIRKHKIVAVLFNFSQQALPALTLGTRGGDSTTPTIVCAIKKINTLERLAL